MKKAFKVILPVLLALLVILSVGGYFYWQHLKQTPVYSLALLIDSARNDDNAAIENLIDIDAVVEDFIPQITNKAFERYGRSLPAGAIEKLTEFARPFLPAIKQKAAAELPQAIKSRTLRFADIPFPFLVAGADRYLDVKYEGDTAIVTSIMQDRPLELKMKKVSNKWVITGVKDDQTATMIADKIGQQIIAAAATDNLNQAGRSLGVKNLRELIEQAEDLIK